MQTLKDSVLAALGDAEKLNETVTDPADRRRLESVLVYLRRTAKIMDGVSPGPEYDPMTFAAVDAQPIAADAATDVDVEE